MNVRVETKCVGCGHRQSFGPNDVEPGEHPMCERCFMPMVPIKAEVKDD